MTLYEFNQLDEMEQMETVWEGVFVADREDRWTQNFTLSDRWVLCRSVL